MPFTYLYELFHALLKKNVNEWIVIQNLCKFTMFPFILFIYCIFYNFHVSSSLLLIVSCLFVFPFHNVL